MTDLDLRELGPPPPSLYRYRPSGDVVKGYLQELVANHRIWATSPSKFNDPSDCRVRIDFSGTDDEWRIFLRAQFAKQAALSLEQAATQPAAPLDIPFWRDLAYQSAIQNDMQANVDKTGVICLCDSPTNPLMWAHYSSGHAGICLQFQTSAQPFSECFRVRYQQAIPTTRFNDSADLLVRACLLTKAEWWRYEAEWRFVGYKRGEGHRQVATTALQAVIIGMKAEQSLIDQVVAICKESQSPVRVLQASPRLDAYDLQILPLP